MLERINYRVERDRILVDTGSAGGAKQSFKDETDVNNILALYAKTGLLTPVVSRSPAFVDVSEITDYREAVENVRVAQDLFMALPSVIRSEFENDPAEFLDFCTDPDNEDRMREMGLLPPSEDQSEADPVDEEAAVAAAAAAAAKIAAEAAAAVEAAAKGD